MFQAVLQFIVGLIALMFVAEGQNGNPGAGEEKKGQVLAELSNMIDLLPVTGSLGNAIKVALKALAPTFLTLLVSWANKSDFFKQ